MLANGKELEIKRAPRHSTFDHESRLPFDGPGNVEEPRSFLCSLYRDACTGAVRFRGNQVFAVLAVQSLDNRGSRDLGFSFLSLSDQL